MMTYEQLAQAYAQACRVRDMALAQLEDIGAGYAEKMDDFARVVRCRNCVYCVHAEGTDIYKCGSYSGGLNRYVKPDQFCSYGERKEQ